jgi:hypothetical protein
MAESNTPQPMDAAGECSLYDELSTKSLKRRNLMLWTIIVILLILWLLGFFGRNISPSLPQTGNWIHILVVVAVILIVLSLLKII